jgi:hypothetical protein
MSKEKPPLRQSEEHSCLDIQPDSLSVRSRCAFGLPQGLLAGLSLKGLTARESS